MALDASLASWLTLSQIPGLGNEGLRRLLRVFGSPDAVLDCSVSFLSRHIKPAVAQAILKRIDVSSLADVSSWLDDPLDAESLSNRSGLTIGELSAILLQLELDGRIASLPGGLYQRIA